MMPLVLALSVAASPAWAEAKADVPPPQHAHWPGYLAMGVASAGVTAAGALFGLSALCWEDSCRPQFQQPALAVLIPSAALLVGAILFVLLVDR
jgi:hypothetical protein